MGFLPPVPAREPEDPARASGPAGSLQALRSPLPCPHRSRSERARLIHTADSPGTVFTTKSHADENREAVLENKLQQAHSELAERVAERDAAHRELGEKQDSSS